ncbi:3-phosphoglycerate dehydrogenase family protein [Legionella hackeliae]|uniref:D-3-phosphoglycerate dehydrogenase n=1 Tax=Legionella hackeliae TaxID=449 RepID=A0A0A8UX13_LEGHA|nr:3-phosphoglycerate dehydrogenase family protein [Legionella hackeliae]KTD10075.1 D-isomer specific 2-hydroxyacid dehydrogenase [Legionella hackeliae]CEK11617.1 putative D-isomer specific 2-hydroxyacid dehydrogenase [Legionella hackeliae]STX48389.1 D-isomer specific 2-hydroxyacid dehydrogenase [Legionella hackeliae]
MFKIQTLDNMLKKASIHLNSKNYNLSEFIDDPDAILLRSTSLHEYLFGKNLKAIARAGTGTDNIPVNYLTKIGVPVFFAPGANSNAVKELVIAAILMGYRNLSESHYFIDELNVNKQSNQLKSLIEEGKKKFVGHEILAKTLGVVGLGCIGVKVANSALALGMKVIGYDPGMSINNALDLMPGVQKTSELYDIYKNSDIVTLHIPLKPETANFINQESLQFFKHNTLLLNFSRETIVNESAIIEYIKRGTLMGYITDFPTRELVNCKKVLCFPHLGASTVESEQKCAQIAIKNLQNFLEKGFIDQSVNFPNISLTPTYEKNYQRLLIINSNTPGALSQITTQIGKLGYNIEQITNKSQNDIAINLLDLSGPNISFSQFDNVLNKIESLIRLRIINSNLSST